jgi:arsenite-transporting ATPase
LGGLIGDLARHRRGVILTMGKGGVGKTTVATAVAIALADLGFPVHLSTTDPAAHVAATLNGSVPHLTIGRIDPKAETEAYSAEVLATAGKDLDAQGRSMLEEDLRSPCTEEIAVFRAFAASVAKGQDGFVVLDTAPTGHTLLLLDSALAYHREVTRQSSGMPEAVENLLPRLRDAAHTRVLIVTLPEATPVHEAAKLQEDLGRAGIHPFAWVVNQSLTPLAPTDPVLVARRAHEARFLREIAERHARRLAVIPWTVDPPVGPKLLRELVSGAQPPS